MQKPRVYQLQCLEAIAQAQTMGQNRLLVKMPTGTGKTVMFAALLKKLAKWLSTFHERERKMLVIAHREELLDQAAEKIANQNPELIVSIEQGDRHAHALSDVVVASIQTLSAMKFRRLKSLLQQHTFRLVIVDEAHHAAADTYRTALALLQFLPMSDASDVENLEAPKYEEVAELEKALHAWEAIAPKDRLLVGVTATPNRSDAIGLGCVFQSIVYSYDLRRAVNDKWLVPIVPWVVESDTCLDDVKIQRGDFNQKQLADIVNTDTRNHLAVAAWQEYAEHIPTLAFTVDVAHAHQLAETFVEQGVRAVALSGKTDPVVRRQMLQDFRDGKIEVITNCMVLTEGTDLPMAGCILHAKPTKSATLYEQMTGRGLRINPGKTQCIVIDLVDVARRHSLQTAPVLYGLPPGLQAQGKTLDEAADELEEILEKYKGYDAEKAGRFTLAQLRARASTFDIWTVPTMGTYGVGLSMDWMPLGDERFRIQYPWNEGNESLTVERSLLGTFDIVATFRSRPIMDGTTCPAVVRHGVRQRTVVAGLLTASEALKVSEAYIRRERTAVVKLTDQNAAWKQRPASKGQIAYLDRLRVPYDVNITMGEAGKLIDLGKARKSGR
jgi:ATP-dependent helicase IRC3